jgi:hypothetical protein
LRLHRLRGGPQLGSRLRSCGLRPSLRLGGLRRLNLRLNLGPSRLRLSWLRRRLDRLSGLGLLKWLGLQEVGVVPQLLHPLVLLEEVLRLALLPLTLLPPEEAHKSGAERQYIFLPPVQD